MGNPNPKNPLLCGDRKLAKQAVQILQKPKVPKQQKSILIALILTGKDIKKLEQNNSKLIKGIARRSGAKIEIMPRVKNDGDGEPEREVRFAGNEVAVSKAKTWVKELDLMPNNLGSDDIN
ncbi:hypothetical protein DL98DRAFT_591000 [Cadophora sp. DSE1049]|nr:hypothetical protein DL98DRAFT_591000 [Cadophora sp. DSE1049]